MGEVYRARDTKLDRDVAIKVLPAALAQHPDRLARFEREAKVLAALNHPNIAAIYGLEDRAIVMELVEGPTLADRIATGALPLDESLKIAAQIADALEAAHEKVVVHRDLKPANVKVRHDGTVKVLDFGLATALQSSTREAGSGANSPTLTMGATEVGVIMGTASYMSPEQAAGKPVDRRADIWSFGVVLWEMLTGTRLFDGESVSHTLADVLRAGIDFVKLPVSTPSTIRELLKRCLDRDLKTRLRDIGEARIAIQKYLANPVDEATGVTETIAGPSRPRFGMVTAAVAVVATLALAAVSVIHFREQPPPAELVRFQVAMPENTTLNAWVPLSPDGRMAAFIAEDRDGRRRIWVRPLDVLQARPIAEVGGNALPFWSPDSRSLAYYAGGKLKKVDFAGGPPVNLCDISFTFRGGAWSPEGVIIYGASTTGLWRVSQSGGVPAALTILDGPHGEANHDHPFFLPDGRHFLYLRRSGAAEREGIYIGSLDNVPEKQPSQRLLAASSQAEYAASPGAASGHLLFLRDNTLMAQPFDPAKLVLSGDPVPVADPLFINGDYAYFSSSAGRSLNPTALSYLTGTAAQAQLTWLDRAGKTLGKPGEPILSSEVAISPDGSQAAMVRNGDIWVLEFARNSSSRLTSDPAAELAPIWSPDGKRVVFSSARVGAEGLSVKAANGATPEEQVLKSSGSVTPTSWSRDGKFLLYTSIDSKTKTDIWMMPAPGSSSSSDGDKPKPFLQTADSEGQAQFSPDGKWVVYASTESGTGEIYVRSFPDAGNKVKISTGGGVEPCWSADGKEIFYRNNRQVMAVPVTAGSIIHPGSPKVLFEVTLRGAGAMERHPNWIVSPDGKRFLAQVTGEANNSEPITVLLNWQAGLKR